MLISLKQINNTELSNLILSLSTGSNFNAALFNYFSNTGWVGNGALTITGNLQQNIFGLKLFDQPPLVPSGGANPSGAAPRFYVDDKVTGQIGAYSGWATGEYARTNLPNTFTDSNVFLLPISVPRAASTGDATNLYDLQVVSGVLNSGLQNISIVGVIYNYGEQHITGRKIFDTNPYVSTPNHPSGVPNLDYITGGTLSIGYTVKQTGNQDISGIKNFLQSPTGPIAVSSNQFINKAQFDAGINGVSVGTGSIQGVSSVNSRSGVVLLDGAGGVSVIECSGIIYVSGNAQNTKLYSVSIPLTSGATGISFSYNPVFEFEPNVQGTLKYAGQGALSYVYDTIFNSTSGGFNVAFSGSIPSTGYYYNISAIPVSGSSGFLGIQGERGFSATNFRQRGRWQAGLLYNPYDVVFTTPNFVSYWTTGTSISDSFNAPSGTGTSLWQILSSGQQGPTGYFIYRGSHDTGTIYYQKDTVIYDGSTYVYTGSSPASGFTPEALTGNWGLVAAKAPLGYYVNSGVVTGNFTNLSFYISPVSTGLELAESFVCRSFFFTGFALACVNTGNAPINGGILTGRIYTHTIDNTKVVLQNFTFDSGVRFFRSGDFSYPITGDNRVGIDILNTMSGIDKFSIGVFGFGT